LRDGCTGAGVMSPLQQVRPRSAFAQMR
jgi:hypothetical protein